VTASGVTGARLALSVETFPTAGTFTISRGSRTEVRVLTVTATAGDHGGRGEGVPYARYGETPDSVAAQVAGLCGPVDHASLADLLPPGAARCAVDGALWDLAARTTGVPVWRLLGLAPPRPVVTCYTLSLDTPAAMQAAAAANAWRPVLKVKLGGPGDMARIEAVRAGAPQARLVVDANEAWTPEVYADLAPHLVRLGVALVEQPLPAGADAALADMARPLPVCADESCHDRASLAGLAGRYDWVNVKLDKTGGLTEALATIAAARAMGLRVMVGCMVGTSLAMAPAVLAAQGADLADLDGPLLLAQDRPNGLRYDDAGVHPPDPALWGGP
jgi:L-alanine-DL-glutamate epimerase-like enolase superfamily enzyme